MRCLVPQLLKVRNRMGICSRWPKLHAKFMVTVWGIKNCALKAPVQWHWSYTILHFPQKINPHFYFFGTIFHYFHPAPPNMGVFGPFFAIRNEFHTIGVECGSSMVGMQPWFTCSLGLHALFVDTLRKVQYFLKSACRAADCVGFLSPKM